MDELIDKIAAATGVERDVARRAAGIIVNFVRQEAPPGLVAPLLEKLPGAGALADEFGGSAGGGLLGVFNDLAGAGLGMTEIQSAASTFLDFAKARAGETEVNAVIAGVPGLGQFI